MLDRVINVIVAALFGAFLLAFCIFIWSASSCEPSSKKQNDSGSSAPDQISGEIFNVGFLKRFGVIVANHPNETAAFSTAAATAFIAWFTIVLSRIGRQQAADARIIQRAHVFPLSPQHQFLTNNAGASWGLRLWVPWKNSGTTPASPVKSFIGVTWVSNPDLFQFGAPDAPGQHQPFVLGPDAEIPSGTVDITLKPFTDLLMDREGAQFLWGWARYQDVFDSTVWHVVEFCFRVTADGQLGRQPPPRVNFTFYGPHNRYYDETA